MSSGRTNRLGWKLWYADGSNFSNFDGSPAEAPPVGVQCVVQIEKIWGEAQPRVQSGGEWYVYDSDDDYWYLSDLDGLHRRLLERPFKLAVKAGEYIPTSRYEEIRDAAREDARAWPVE